MQLQGQPAGRPAPPGPFQGKAAWPSISLVKEEVDCDAPRKQSRPSLPRLGFPRATRLGPVAPWTGPCPREAADLQAGLSIQEWAWLGFQCSFILTNAAVKINIYKKKSEHAQVFFSSSLSRTKGWSAQSVCPFCTCPFAAPAGPRRTQSYRYKNNLGAETHVGAPSPRARARPWAAAVLPRGRRG